MSFMRTPTIISWNEENEARHVAKHGIRFDFAAAVFADNERFEHQDTRKPYQPPRFNTVGIVDGLCINVTFAIDADTATIISARPASRKERSRYAS